jgi:hypothetical protein
VRWHATFKQHFRSKFLFFAAKLVALLTHCERESVGERKWQWVISFSERAPYKQQAVENHSIICQMKTQPASWLDDSGSQFFFLPCERQISTHRGACIN